MPPYAGTQNTRAAIAPEPPQCAHSMLKSKEELWEAHLVVAAQYGRSDFVRSRPRKIRTMRISSKESHVDNATLRWHLNLASLGTEAREVYDEELEKRQLPEANDTEVEEEEFNFELEFLK